MTELSVVGKGTPRLDASAKVTGKAKYTSDYQERGLLRAKLLLSPHPHAKILGIDTSRAEKLPGVRAVITGHDQPDRRIGQMVFDMLPLARNVVRWVGEPMVAVAADTIEIAENALELIDCKYAEMEAIFDPEEAMKPDCSVVVHPQLPSYQRITFGGVPIPAIGAPNVFNQWQIVKGDVESGFQQSDLIIENRYSTHRVSHCCLEPHQADAWLDAEEVLSVRSPRQGVYRGKNLLCRFLDLPPSKVRMLEPYIGGAFGGRIDNSVELIAAMLALKTGRPVRLILSRGEVFTSAVHKAPFVIYIKDGAKDDGTLMSREIKFIMDSGAYSQSAVAIVRNASFGAVGTYRMPNFKWNSYGVYTNHTPSAAYRGFGSPEVQWAIEQQMDIIANRLGIDPVELRRKNLLREGDRNAQGQITESIGAEACLEKVADWLGWGKPTEEITAPWRRGKGIAVGNKYSPADIPSCVHIKVHSDRVVEVRHGLDELGQGLNTVVAQITAEEFGVSIDDVRVVWGDTAFVPWDWASVGSRSTWTLGNALRRACQDAKRQIFQLAAPKLRVNPMDLETENWQVFAKGFPGKTMQLSDLFSPLGFIPGLGELTGKGEYACPKTQEDPETGQAERATAYYMHGAYGMEIVVNVETGEIKLERIAGCFDMGQPINPKMCEQQIEGGIGQAIGYMLYEEILENNGAVINPDFTDYKVPTAMEMPSNENVSCMIAFVPHIEGPFGAKGLGEGVLSPLAPALANAFHNATGVRIMEMPLTKERVWRALRGCEVT